jgi:hypothetical protein
MKASIATRVLDVRYLDAMRLFTINQDFLRNFLRASSQQRAAHALLYGLF